MNRYSSQSLERGESASSYGLTPLQEGMLYDHLTASNPALDVEQVVGEFQATLDIQVYEEAWSTIAVHHDVLRSRFYVLDDGRARQEVVPAVQHPFSSEDLSGKSDQQVQQQIQKYLDEDRRRGFSLDQAPASRAHVFILGENRYVLVWTFHHIILDGRSHARVLRDVYEVYEHLKSGVTSETPEIEVRGSFRDYVEQATACSEDQATNDHAETYWRKRLASIESPTRLPQLGLGGELQDQAAGHDDVSIEISDARFNRLQEVIRTHSLTINSVLQAAWSLLLARYTGEACVVFGSIRANPPLVKPAAKAPIGIYINNLPTVADVGASQSLVDLAKSIQLSQFTEMREFAHVPLSNIQSWSPLTSKSALFDSLFVYDHRDLSGALRALDSKFDRCDLKLLEQTRYAVTLLAFGEPQPRVVLRFDRRQLDAQIAKQILGHFQQVLDQFCHAAEAPISDLKILAEGEREKLIHGFNETEAEYPEDETLDSMFRAQCERTPDSPAVISEQETWSYRQLSDHAAEELR